MRPFADFYRDKRVLITGHTGFKGSWLTLWLTHLGARVIGYSLEPPSDPSNFSACRLPTRITHVHGDVRDYAQLERVFDQHRPIVIFHLAAQSLVQHSFREPRRTFEVNLMGTVNVLEVSRRCDSVRAVVAITSDKCYLNLGWPWGYRETDQLGGYEPYSASKACAELAIAAYQHPRFQHSASPPSDLPIASARAGNVIGGGDWARDRIVPDTIRALISKSDIVLRSPEAIRPWQHVLEPLSGYLWLGSLLTKDRSYCSPWNLGPAGGQPVTVAEMVRRILDKWSSPSTRLIVEGDSSGRESQMLRLDSSKAYHSLGWRSTWDLEHTLEAIVAWYRRFYLTDGADMYSFSVEQIEEYTRGASNLGIAWAQSGES
jgi:CDP-glucose 4,6-dehydratase